MVGSVGRVGLVVAVALITLGTQLAAPSAHARDGATEAAVTRSGTSAGVTTGGTTDDLLASVGEQVPAFGGMYVDEGSGNLYIWLTDQGQSLSSAARALQGALGIPVEVVEIVKTEPVTFTGSLQDTWRPVLGGIQVEWTDDVFFVDKICTFGFVASRNGVGGFVTASHCTTNQGAVDSGGVWHQATAGFCHCSNNIGKETVDPPMFSGGSCPSGRICRHSDASFATLDTGVTRSRGFIARTALGSTTWNGTNTYRITSSDIPTVGETVNLEGRTSGRLNGSVTGTCVTVNISNSNVTILCAAKASMTSQEGDSGSPVFRINSGTDVFLQGLEFAGGGSTMYYSTINEIQLSGELGTLSFCAPGFCGS